jgi:hypothetical protein
MKRIPRLADGCLFTTWLFIGGLKLLAKQGEMWSNQKVREASK